MRKDTHLFGLDVLRFVAAWLVVADHFGSYGWAHASATVPDSALAFPFLKGMDYIGSIGVEIFFLISGFVIAASAKGTSARRFILNRAIRVAPALWICGLIAVAARATTGESIHDLVACFIRSAILSPVGPYIDGVVWTLIVEAMFYLLIFLVLLRDGFSRIATVATVLGIVSALFVATMAFVTVWAQAHPSFATLAAICDRFPFKVFLLRHGVFFAVGILLWSGFDSGFSRAKLGWMLAFSAFCTLEITINRGGPHDVAIAIALWWAGLATLVLSVIKRQWIADRLRGQGGLVRAMGRFSYPLYLNHYTFGMVIVPVLFALGLPRGGVLALSLALVSLTSTLIMLYPERQLQTFAKQRLGRFLIQKPKLVLVGASTGRSQPDRPVGYGIRAFAKNSSNSVR